MKIDDIKITVTFETSVTATTSSVVFTEWDIARPTYDKIIKLLNDALGKQERQKNQNSDPRDRGESPYWEVQE